MRTVWGLIAGIAALTTAAGAAHFADASPLLTFAIATLALAGLAWVVSFATEQVGERFGPAVTGVLQSTLGNLPEFFVVVFALSAGEVVVARTAILGSIFANALLVLGLVIVAGAWRSNDGVMRFQARLPNDTVTLLMLAVFIIVVLGLSDQVGDRAGTHLDTISAIGAILLLSVYAVWLWSYLRGAPSTSGDPASPRHRP